MRYPIIVPALGRNDESFLFGGWLVEMGDLVLAGDLVAEVMIPGLVFEVMAESSGRLVEIAKITDATVAAGETLGWLDDGQLD